MDSIDRLVQYYNNGPEDIYHETTANILKHIHEVKDCTIYDLAELCYTSPSTISRLVKKLSFENFNDFRSQISYALKNYQRLNRNTRDLDLIEDADIVPLYFNFLSNNIRLLENDIDYEQIRAISDLLYAADRTYFYAMSEMTVNNLQKALIVTNKTAFSFDTLFISENTLRQLKEGDLIFAMIPDLTELSPMRSILKDAKNKGASVITICSGKNNEYARYSDLQLSFEGTKTSMDLYLFMILTNLIKYDFTHRYVDRLLEELY